MSNKSFQKFMHGELKGAAKKESFKKEKRESKIIAKEIGSKNERSKESRTFNSSPKKFQNKSFESQEADSFKFKKGYNPPKLNNVAYRKEVQELRNWTPDAATIAAAAKAKTEKKPFKKPYEGKIEKKFSKEDFSNKNRLAYRNKNIETTFTPTEKMPLNKFVAHCGICGRREAAELIKKGVIKVNNQIITEPGFKVLGNEDVRFNGKKLFVQQNLVYILVNKPKDYITTAKDPEGRKTVIDLIGNATTERVYPVGRLDRNTTGVLLMTNDGELAQKLTHPSFQIKKIYEVKLDKPVVKKDLDAIANGITLEDGFIKADSVAYADAKDKSVIGIEIHSGKNRIVRRIFEKLGYDVKGLDRVMFANLTKKNVDRGKYRFLSEKEVRLLKFMNKSFSKKN